MYIILFLPINIFDGARVCTTLEVPYAIIKAWLSSLNFISNVAYSPINLSHRYIDRYIDRSTCQEVTFSWNC